MGGFIREAQPKPDTEGHDGNRSQTNELEYDSSRLHSLRTDRIKQPLLKKYMFLTPQFWPYFMEEEIC